MRTKIILIVCLLFFSLPLLAAEGLITKASANSVDETITKMKNVLASKGIKVMAEVDHQSNAAGVDLKMGKAKLLIFGNPKLGTPLMTSSITTAIDLPMKLLVWRDAEGKVWLAYNDPQYFAKRHAIKDRDEVLKKMAGALNMLTDKAAH